MGQVEFTIHNYAYLNENCKSTMIIVWLAKGVEYQLERLVVPTTRSTTRDKLDNKQSYLMLETAARH